MFEIELLSRIQFAITIGFHYIYPPLSIGLGIILVVMEGMYLKTKKPIYEEMTKFWVKVFALTFAMGVATGIVMEFEFGTNWATYSRYVGDVFGSALAAEGIFAFFLESGFLAILVFGWDKVGPKTHFFATLMVSIGSMLSAVWIVVANSWQQTPAGHHIVDNGFMQRAEIVDFWAMVFNPSSMERLSHTLSGCFLAGAFLVVSVGAYYIIKKRHIEFARNSIKIGLTVAFIASLLQLLTGHQSADTLEHTQPTKLAAIEAHYAENAPADMYLWGWVDEENDEVDFGIKIPGMLSFLLSGDTQKTVKGLLAYPEEDRPPVNIVFQSYHIMVGIGFTIIALTVIGIYLLWRKKLITNNLFLKILVISVLLPQLANQLGWITAEVGRQPWIVWGLLRTSEAVSKVVSEGQVIASLIMFTGIYLGLFVLFLFLLNHKIQHGPEDIRPEDDVYQKQETVAEKTSRKGRQKNKGDE